MLYSTVRETHTHSHRQTHTHTNRSQMMYSVQVSYFEIYLDKIRDLLDGKRPHFLSAFNSES